MKSEQVEGVVEKVAGKAQSAVGKLLGDSKIEVEGAGRQYAGQLSHRDPSVLCTGDRQ